MDIPETVTVVFVLYKGAGIEYVLAIYFILSQIDKLTLLHWL